MHGGRSLLILRATRASRHGPRRVGSGCGRRPPFPPEEGTSGGTEAERAARGGVGVRTRGRAAGETRERVCWCLPNGFQMATALARSLTHARTERQFIWCEERRVKKFASAQTTKTTKKSRGCHLVCHSDAMAGIWRWRPRPPSLHSITNQRSSSSTASPDVLYLVVEQF